MFKEISFIVLLGLVLSQIAKSQTTGSYWGFDPTEQTTTQNWWGDNVDTGEFPETTEAIPDATSVSTTLPQIAAAGVVLSDVVEPTASETSVTPPGESVAATNVDPNPSETANSTTSGLHATLLCIPFMGFVMFN